MSGVGEGTSAQLVGTLGFAGLLSGLALVVAYEQTLPVILENRAAALRVAVLRVVPGATEMQRLSVVDGKLVAQAKGEGDAIYAAYGEGGTFVGYAIPSAGNGFADVISLLYGYDPGKQAIVGFSVLESRETPGLGDKIYKDVSFTDNFRELLVSPTIVPVKHGKKTAANEVDCITGATISSKAVVRILNEGNARWLGLLPPPGQEPALAGATGGTNGQ